MLLFLNRIKTRAANLGVQTVGEFTVFAPAFAIEWNRFVLDITASANANAYDIFINGALVAANHTALNYVYSVASPSTEYDIRVTAKGAGYLSRSVDYSVTTIEKPFLADPGIDELVGTNLSISFQALLTDTSQASFVSHFSVYVDGVHQGNYPTYGGVTADVLITGVAAGMRTILLQAISNNLAVMDNSAQVDFVVEVVAGLKLATPVVESITTTPTSISLTVAVVSQATVYDFYLNDALTQTGAGRTYAPTGLAVDTEYALKVIARRTTAPVYADSDPLLLNATTSELDGTPVELGGLKAMYEPFYGNITITPLPAEKKCLITYTGEGNPFQASWVADDIEFCGFRCNRNPAANPPSSATNGNYLPNTVSCRYAYVTDYVDGKNVKVARTKGTNTEVPFNGGNIATPQVVTNAHGYFFFNNRTALKALLESTTRETTLLMRSDPTKAKTYVIKGGSWAAPGAGFLDLLLKSDGIHAIKPRIKFSWEDANFLYETGLPSSWAVNSYLNTFSYPPVFRVADRATPYSIVIDGIDVIGSAFAIPGAEFNAAHLKMSFFSGSGTSFAGLFKIKNSNCWAERHEVEALIAAETIPALPTGGLNVASWLLPQFAESTVCGLIAGDVNAAGTDIVTYADFVLEASNWEAIQVHGVKAGGWNPPPSSKWDKTGGIFRLIGANAELPAHAYSRHNGVILSSWSNIPLTIAKGSSGNFTSLVVQSGSFSWFQIWNGYNVGGRSGATDVYRDSGKEHYVEIQNDLGEVFHIQLASKDALPAGYTFPTVSGSEWACFEAIPVGQGHADPPSTITPIAKISNTVFDIKGWSLTGRNNRNLYVLSGSAQIDGAVSTVNTSGDVLQHGGVDYEILEKSRRTIVEGGKTIPIWRITLSGSVADATPTFNVKTSRLQFALNGSARNAFIKSDGVAGYFSYASTESNVQFKDCVIIGPFRATGKPMTASGLTTPLHVLPFIKEYTRCLVHDSQTASRMENWGGVGLKMRGDRLSLDLRVIIDGSRIPLYQTRIDGTGDPFTLRNKPILMFGTSSYGEPRLVDIELADENGMLLEAGASFFFTNPAKTYNLRNIEVLALYEQVESGEVKAIPTSMRVWGKGTLDISGMTSGKNRFNSPFDGNGFSTEYFMSVRMSRQTGIYTDATSAGCQLNIIGSGGEIGIDTRGFGVDPVFASNSILLTDWVLKPIEGSFSGYARGTGWPLVSETHANFSITGP